MGKIIIYNSKTDDFTSQKNNFYCGRQVFLQQVPYEYNPPVYHFKIQF